MIHKQLPMTVFIMALAGVACPAYVSGAQTIVPNEPLCRTCIIEVTPLVRIGDSNGPGAIPGRPRSIAIDRRGRYWLILSGEPPKVYSPQGRFTAAIGRSGGGPGEFRSPFTVVSLPGDSMLIVEFGSARASVISADFKFVRSFMMPPLTIHDAVVLEWPARVFAQATGYSESSIGWPFHLVDTTGEQAAGITSVGLDNGEIRPGESFRLLHSLSLSRSGTVWAAERLQYRLSEWSRDARPLRVLIRRPAWFSRRSNGALGSGPDRPPDPEVVGITQDEQGRLWTAIQVPAPNWTDLWKNIEVPKGIAEVSGDFGPPFHRKYRTRIEVIDPESGRLIASGETEHAAIAALPGNRLVSYALDSGDVPHLRLLSIALRERSQ